MGKQIVCMLMYDNGEHAQKIKVQTKAPLQSRHIIDWSIQGILLNKSEPILSATIFTSRKNVYFCKDWEEAVGRAILRKIN